MKKYDISKIMKRAWEIKRSEDTKKHNSVLNLESAYRELREDEKALFSECLKMAWKEAKRACDIEEEYSVSKEDSMKMSKKETELKSEGHYGITWNIWSRYGYCRAYYKCADNSKYQNDKKDHYVNLAA